QLEAAQRRLEQFDAVVEKFNRDATRGPQIAEKTKDHSGRPSLEAPPTLGFKGKLPDGSYDPSSAAKRSPADGTDDRSREKRLAKVEADLRELMDEVRQLRNESRNKDKDKHAPGGATPKFD